jgi:hypothetical protein
MREHPLPTANLWLKKAVRYWYMPIGYESALQKSIVLARILFFIHWFTLLAAGVGIAYTWRQYCTQVLGLTLGYIWILHIVLLAIPRYHYPLWPCVQVLAIVGLWNVVGEYAKQK